MYDWRGSRARWYMHASHHGEKGKEEGNDHDGEVKPKARTPPQCNAIAHSLICSRCACSLYLAHA